MLVILHVGVCCAVVSDPCSLMVTCWERADLLAVVFVVFCHFPNISGPHQNYGRGWCSETGLSPPVKYFTDRSKVYFFCGSFFSVLYLLCLNLYVSVYLCLVVTCLERADLLALVCDV